MKRKKSRKLKLKLIHFLSKKSNIVQHYHKAEITILGDKKKRYLITFEIE